MYFLVSIFLDYANFIKYDFEVVDNFLFINSHKVEELFYRKFFHTKIFKNFIIKKIYPINLEDKIDILYFDERIVDKKNKNAFANSQYTTYLLSI